MGEKAKIITSQRFSNLWGANIQGRQTCVWLCGEEPISWGSSGPFHLIAALCKLTQLLFKISSVQFSRSVVFNSLRPHGMKHARLPCTSPIPGVFSDSCPLSWWCHPTISSSVVPFSSCLQTLLASGSFQMNQFFTSGGQSIRVSASASVLPMNIQDWFPLGWTSPSPRSSSPISCQINFPKPVTN